MTLRVQVGNAVLVGAQRKEADSARCLSRHKSCATDNPYQPQPLYMNYDLAFPPFQNKSSKQEHAARAVNTKKLLPANGLKLVEYTLTISLSLSPNTKKCS